MYRSIVALGSCAIVVLAACEPRKSSCFDLTAPGVVIYSPALDLTIRDVYGRGEAFGDTVVVHSGADSVVTTGIDSLRVTAGYTTPGSFLVRVSRPFYRDVVLPNVVVRPGACSAEITNVSITLQLLPGAPPIRSVAVIGTEFLTTPGEQLSLRALIDADPGVPAAVIWRLSDT
ncbi:MAG: hypothetical protein M3081_03580, partial [Gemmatimonadota bacterium]|nr:hypothetical protein [Gemmatimonadota bacterium]